MKKERLDVGEKYSLLIRISVLYVSDLDMTVALVACQLHSVEIII